jgi:arabinofuranan 3-O-arabinosyltransferase
VADGRAAVPVTVNGWQRGWRLPATGSTEVEETFTANTAYRAALVLGAVTALALIGIVLVRGRRPRHVADAQQPRDLSIGGFLGMFALLGLVAGTAGVAVALIGAAIGSKVATRREPAAWWVAATLLPAVGCYAWWAIAGGDVPVIPWRFPQLCAALSLGVVVGVVWRRRPGASDMNGLSTTR